MLGKFKPIRVQVPEPPANPNLPRQTDTGSFTNLIIGGWKIEGSRMSAGGMILDASKPFILMNDGSTNRVVLGNV